MQEWIVAEARALQDALEQLYGISAETHAGDGEDIDVLADEGAFWY